MSNFFEQKRIVVTGGAGFLGKQVVKKLYERGCRDIFIPRSAYFDLTKTRFIQKMYHDFKPDIVIHLAALVGDINANQESPGKFFYDNLMMGINLIEYGRVFDIEKFVAIGTVCSYPEFAQTPFKEETLWNGYPEEAHATYGLAKKMLLVQSEAYRAQYKFNSIFLLPANLYGPHDNFDLRTAHVIPALIRKCFDAKRNKLPEITVWGDGNPKREFLYVADAAEGILMATEHYDESIPVNLGNGFEISIKNLALKIAELVGYEGSISWDKTKPNGQPRRVLDTSKALEKFNFKANTKLDEGLRETIEWYKEIYN